MSFGKNPYVAKAVAAELKADEAPDDISRVRARREAAREWTRAAEREQPGKKRDEYEASATKNRELADGDQPETGGASEPVDPRLLN